MTTPQPYGDPRSIRQLVLDATAVDGAAPGARGGQQRGRGRRRQPNSTNHTLPTPRQLQAVKAIGKRSRDNIRALYDAIMERLSFPSSHVRVCALEIYEVLFVRSCAFRRLACDRLDILLARAVLGELPSPPAYAEELRHRALRLLRKWNGEFGAVQPKLGLACRHLENLGIFDETDGGDGADAADGERGSREGAARTNNDANVVSPTVERAVEDFQSSVAQWHILVKELENARVVLESSKRPTVSTGIDADDDEAWEEVGEEGDLTDDVYVPLMESYREASSETIPQLQRIIAACRQMYTTGYNERVSNVLQEAIQLNASLVSACSAYERKLGDTVRRARKSHEKRNEQEKRVHDRAERDVSMQKRRDPRLQQPPVNPMQLIRDPTMPRDRPKAKTRDRSFVGETASNEHAHDTKKRSVLKKLAAVAPVVPVGGFAGVWDSDVQTTAVLGQAMEVTNHWGPVDVTKELPKDRLDALFLIDQTKIKYNEGDGPQGSGQQRQAPCLHPQTQQQRQQQRHQQRQSPLQPAPTQLTDRVEERRFNEQLLRRAALASGFGFIDNDNTSVDGSSTASERRGIQRKPLNVKESLTKKLKLN